MEAGSCNTIRIDDRYVLASTIRILTFMTNLGRCLFGHPSQSCVCEVDGILVTLHIRRPISYLSLVNLPVYNHDKTMSSSKRLLEELGKQEDTDGVDVGDTEPLAKKVKGKGKEEAKMVTSKIIPVEGKGHITSLKDIPGEILDRIFCLRPQLEVSQSGLKREPVCELISKCWDYVALAGTCKYFREHMTDDFWSVRTFNDSCK